MYSSLLVGLAITVGAPASKDPPKKESPSIVGEWAGEKAVAGGKEKPVPEGGVTIRFTADGKFIVREGKREQREQGMYKVDGKKEPAEIDITPPADQAERGTMQGIYKVDGDTLTLCIARGAPGAERPKTFESPAGSEVMVMTLRRAKKE